MKPFVGSAAEIAAVVVKGCVVSVRLFGRADAIVGQVVRSLDASTRTFAMWPIGWEDVVCIELRQVEAATIADLTREQLRAVRARQRGGSL